MAGGNSGCRQVLYGPVSCRFLTPFQGKTVLASTIIEEIQSLQSVALAYFFCKHRDPRRDNFKAVLRGLVVQLLHQNLDLLPYIYEKCTSSGEVILASLVILNHLFDSILRVSKSAFIILDGIDECDRGERGRILTYINATVSSIEKDGADGPKVLYISRDEGDIRKILSKVPTKIITPQDNEQDIKQYTTSQSADIQDKFEIRDSLRENIISMVCDRARGALPYVQARTTTNTHCRHVSVCLFSDDQSPRTNYFARTHG
jgi:hypothetical protein